MSAKIILSQIIETGNADQTQKRGVHQGETESSSVASGKVANVLEIQALLMSDQMLPSKATSIIMPGTSVSAESAWNESLAVEQITAVEIYPDIQPGIGALINTEHGSI